MCVDLHYVRTSQSVAGMALIGFWKCCTQCCLQVAHGLVGLWKGVEGQQHCEQQIGLHKLLAKYKMPLSAFKTGTDWLTGLC